MIHPQLQHAAFKLSILLAFSLLGQLITSNSLFAQVQGDDVSLEVFSTNEDTLSIQKLLAAPDQIPFIPTESFGRSTPKDIYWIKLDFSEHQELLTANNEWTLFLVGSERSTLFYQSKNHIGARAFGAFAPLNKERATLSNHKVSFRSTELMESKYLFMRLQMLSVSRNMSEFSVRLVSKEAAEQMETARHLRLYKRWTWDFVFIGLVLIVFLFAAFTYVTQRKKEYLFYCLYLFSLFFYLTRRALGLHDVLFGQFPILEYFAHMEFQILINLFYTLFARHFLNTPKHYTTLDKVIQWIVIGLLALICLDIFLISFSQFTTHLILMDVQRYIMALFGVAASIYLVVKAKSPLVYFIVAGSIAYTLGALGTLFFWNNNYMIAGASIEIFVFTMGLGYKNRHLLLKNARIEQEAVKLKMSALRAQMNPHFIFNSLGSIQHLVRTEKKEEALAYLSKFSRLLRQILETSIDIQVTLKEEIALLKNYIDLESLRFDGQFEYSIQADPEVDIDNFEIPILLLQPHIENAIIHGLLPKKGNSNLQINFSSEEKHLVCTITDNGIGREKSNERKAKNHAEHKSRGLSLVENRLKQLDSEEEAFILVEDLFSDSLEAIGTKITVRIPKE